MKKTETVLCDSNNDGNLKYRYTVLDSMGPVVIMTSNWYIVGLYLKK